MPDEKTMTVTQMYQLEEYRALRAEIEYYIGEFRSQERSVVIAVGVIWGWLMNAEQWSYLAWSMPVLLTVAAAVRSSILNDHMRVVSNYIESLEDAFAVVGWEHFFTKKVRSVKRGAFANVFLTYALLGLAVIAFLFHDELLRPGVEEGKAKIHAAAAAAAKKE